jgi:hypothetical protein
VTCRFPPPPPLQKLRAQAVTLKTRIAFRALGLLLVVAAALKFYGLQVSAITISAPVFDPQLQMAALNWELLLGGCLVLLVFPWGTWLAAVGTFVVFAATSIYLGWLGQARCGCFGSIEATPWHALAVDVGALAALVWGRPQMWPLPGRAEAAPLAAVVGGVAILSGIAAGTGMAVFGSVDAAVAYFRRETVSVRPRVLDLGAVEAGSVAEASVEVINRSDRAVKIVGGTSDCSCVATGALPVVVEARSTLAIPVRVRLPRTEGQFNRKAILWTADETVGVIVFPIVGAVHEAPALDGGMK